VFNNSFTQKLEEKFVFRQGKHSFSDTTAKK